MIPIHIIFIYIFLNLKINIFLNLKIFILRFCIYNFIKYHHISFPFSGYIQRPKLKKKYHKLKARVFPFFVTHVSIISWKFLVKLIDLPLFLSNVPLPRIQNIFKFFIYIIYTYKVSVYYLRSVIFSVLLPKF